MISDRKIIEGCLAGKRKAFSQLYNKYAALMMAMCMRYCKNLAEAEDVLQDGFIKVFQNIHKFRGDGSFEGWMKRIIINTAINNYHTSIKYYNQEDIDAIHETNDLDYDNEETDLRLNGSITKDKLMNLIQSLPEGYKMVFNLFAIEGYTHKEIAEILGISENTSKSQLMKARRTLKRKIGEMQKNENL